MSRPLPAAAVAVAVLAGIAVTATAAHAAPPAVSHLGTTTLTTNGRTALTYTGYMNGESFQQDGIVTFAGWQYAAFWDQNGYANIARRRLPGGAWQNLRLTDYVTSSTDSHNVISIGISPLDGRLHLAFDMHSSVLRYRRSAAGTATSPETATWVAGAFEPTATSLDGSAMNQMTYPQFLTAPDGTLQLALRAGLSGSGDELLYEYGNGTWTAIGRIIDGISRNNNAYLFGIEYDATGVLHMTWTVRETPDASTNHDLFHALSEDRGRTWRNTAGSVMALPMPSDAAGLRVWSIGQKRGLINQESQVVDRAGTLHVLASHLPASAPDTADFTAAREKAVLVHYWRDRASKVWHQQYTPFLERSARGDIGVDAADNLYVASGDSSTRKLHIQTASKASGWTDWTIRYTSDPVYYSDPLIDHQRLSGQGVLSIFAPRYGGSQIDVQDWQTGP
jgi:BNR repeat-containing family member